MRPEDDIIDYSVAQRISKKLGRWRKRSCHLTKSARLIPRPKFGRTGKIREGSQADDQNPVALRWRVKHRIIAGLMAGCAVPPHQQVREGVDPEHIDTDVRFRATYYFRVFDFCPPEKRDYVATGSGIRNGSSSQRAADDDMFSPGDSKLLILTDSLYRFRMAGEANALTTTIHFESGALRASEIDPFGSNVEFDQENQRFYRVSHRETKQRAITAGELKRITSARETADRELVKLLERRAAAQASDPNGQLGVALDGLIQKIIATVDALADREHGLLLTESPLRASPSVSCRSSAIPPRP